MTQCKLKKTKGKNFKNDIDMKKDWGTKDPNQKCPNC